MYYTVQLSRGMDYFASLGQEIPHGELHHVPMDETRLHVLKYLLDSKIVEDEDCWAWFYGYMYPHEVHPLPEPSEGFESITLQAWRTRWMEVINEYAKNDDDVAQPQTILGRDGNGYTFNIQTYPNEDLVTEPFEVTEEDVTEWLDRMQWYPLYTCLSEWIPVYDDEGNIYPFTLPESSGEEEVYQPESDGSYVSEGYSSEDSES